MTKFLSPHILRGHIDNTKAGKVEGSLWLAGMSEPVDLVLEGDCLTPLAGHYLTFSRKPQFPSEPLLCAVPHMHWGYVGDISLDTSSHLAAGASQSPLSLFSLEWFTQGERYLIDSSKLDVEIHPKALWKMDYNEEQAQLVLNQQMMRDYVCGKLARFRDLRVSDLPGSADDKQIQWLRIQIEGCDAISEIYREVLEKYERSDHAELREAFVMGWDQLLSSLESTSNNSSPPPQEIAFSAKISESLEDTPLDPPPLVRKILDLAIWARRTLDPYLNLLQEPHCAATEFLSTLYACSAKLHLSLILDSSNKTEQIIKHLHLELSVRHAQHAIKLWKNLAAAPALTPREHSRILIELQSISDAILNAIPRE